MFDVERFEPYYMYNLYVVIFCILNIIKFLCTNNTNKADYEYVKLYRYIIYTYK